MEQKPSDSQKWKPVGATTETELMTSHLPEGQYDFRVVARNEAGHSEPTEVDNVDVRGKRTKLEGTSRIT